MDSCDLVEPLVFLGAVGIRSDAGARRPGRGYSYISKKVRMQWCTLVLIADDVF